MLKSPLSRMGGGLAVYTQSLQTADSVLLSAETCCATYSHLSYLLEEPAILISHLVSFRYQIIHKTNDPEKNVPEKNFPEKNFRAQILLKPENFTLLPIATFVTFKIQ